jgi:formylglycine-generating enzyme required for sulfatase activity
VKLNKLYYIGKHPVTVAQFRRFVEATRYETEAERSGGWTLRSGRWMHVKGVNWRQPGFFQEDSHPVVLVSWADALAFATWATRNASVEIPEKQAGLTVVLPTEAQWELAARSAKNLRYPWGQTWEGSRANHADLCLKNAGYGEFCSSENDGYCFTSPVGSMENESWCGAYDLCGNVWQWCHDWYGDAYYRLAQNSDPAGPSSGTQRALRGGSWLDMPLKCRSFSRRGEVPEMAAANIGFRVAVTWT